MTNLLRVFLFIIASLSAGLFTCDGQATNDLSATVVVVYNSTMPESKDLAHYYAEKRHVPPQNLVGLDLSPNEAISRAEFKKTLQKPLLEFLEEHRFFTLNRDIVPATKDHPGEVTTKVTSSQIRYLLLCYGVPLKIVNDPSIVEPASDNFPAVLKRNDAAVDSELAALPQSGNRMLLTGPWANRYFGATNAAAMTPENGILLVTRLDGPSVQVAKRMLDNSLIAEKYGLWGRAYIDARGLTNTPYLPGDERMKNAAKVCQRYGFETVLDTNEATFATTYPMSQIGLYAGWYDASVSGPFTESKVEFMPGAFAYHLHSFSANVLRTTNQFWVGPLLAKGASASMGCVEEPYLEATPDLPVFFSRFLMLGFTYGEAAYASLNSLSWQITVVGDPLYRPFGKNPQQLHALLEKEHSPFIEWSHLRVVNLNIVTELETKKLIEYLREIDTTEKSAVLQEKLAEIYMGEGNLTQATEALLKALENNPSPEQRVRLTLLAGKFLSLYNRNEEAQKLYKATAELCSGLASVAPIRKLITPSPESEKKAAGN